MFQGNWKCSQCGGAITELPFEPRSESGLTCRDCYMKNKNEGQGQTAAPAPADVASDAPAFDPAAGDVAGEEQPAPPTDLDGATPAKPSERKMFSGEWQCATCGSPITQLPFEPRSIENLKCIDCFKQSKAQ